MLSKVCRKKCVKMCSSWNKIWNIAEFVIFVFTNINKILVMWFVYRKFSSQKKYFYCVFFCHIVKHIFIFSLAPSHIWFWMKKLSDVDLLMICTKTDTTLGFLCTFCIDSINSREIASQRGYVTATQETNGIIIKVSLSFEMIAKSCAFTLFLCVQKSFLLFSFSVFFTKKKQKLQSKSRRQWHQRIKHRYQTKHIHIQSTTDIYKEMCNFEL